MKARFGMLVLASVIGFLSLGGTLIGDNEKPKPEAKAEPATPVKAKPLSEHVDKGLAWLIHEQHEDGGWGQGGGWRVNVEGQGRVEGAQVQDPSDVGNTSIALLALIRAGNSPKGGKYAKSMSRGVEFLCKNVEKADKDSMYITDKRDTQLQSKIGAFIDTFLASLVFAELKGKMPNGDTENRVIAAAEKTLRKIEANQQKDGTWSNQGWASIISQGMCTKALNRSAQNGFKVSDQVLTRAENYARSNFDKKSGKFEGKGGDAGIPLYAASQSAGAVQDAVNSMQGKKQQLEATAKSPKATAAEKGKADRELKQIAELEKDAKDQNDALAKEVRSERFVKGFGNNGGEEFLSFMNISETLVVKGGKEWEDWDQKATKILNECQDKDGSWSGHHCITGKTFCTAAAMLTLMADRAPIPVAVQIKEKQDSEKK